MIGLAGRLSLELYLFHLVVLALIRTALPPAATAPWLRLALLPLYLAVSFLVAFAIGRLFSEPLNRLLRAAGRSAPALPPSAARGIARP